MGFGGTGEKDIYFRGAGEEKPIFLEIWKQRYYWRTGYTREQISIFGNQENKPIHFIGLCHVYSRLPHPHISPSCEGLHR